MCKRLERGRPFLSGIARLVELHRGRPSPPSGAWSVILNWPERIKTQPHDDRDNCFQHFDSKLPLRYDSEQ